MPREQERSLGSLACMFRESGWDEVEKILIKVGCTCLREVCQTTSMASGKCGTAQLPLRLRTEGPLNSKFEFNFFDRLSLSAQFR